MRIVLALDGSPSSIQARDLVAALPWPDDTTITLVTAFDVPVSWFMEVPAPSDWLTDAENGLRRQAGDALAELAGPLEGHGWTIEQRVAEGRAATEILATADDLGADLIVVGSRGRGPIGTMLLGSVSAEIASGSRRSVLVARGSEATRLLVATDGSSCSAGLPQALGDFGVFAGREAVALSVAPVDSPGFAMLVNLYTLGSEQTAATRDELLASHRGFAEDTARQLTDLGIRATAEARTGDAAHEIIAAAREHHADLIVTGSRCLEGVDRWFLGSVARNVLVHAEASVLVVRPGAVPAAT
jgi:nucleotide-binding universal stress UspA family protein